MRVTLSLLLTTLVFSVAAQAEPGSVLASRRAVLARIQDYRQELTSASKAQGRACLWGLLTPEESLAPIVLSADFETLNSEFNLFPHEEAQRIQLLERVIEDRVDSLWREIDALTLRVQILDRLYLGEIRQAEVLRRSCQREYLRTDRARHLIGASERLVGIYDTLASELELDQSLMSSE